MIRMIASRVRARRQAWRAGLGLACAILASMLLTGCAIKMRVGAEPDIEALDRDLTRGVSTRGDVMAALGGSYGEGRALMPFHDEPRVMLTYYYEEGTLEDDRRLFLFVFLHEGKYDGHIWFSSLER